MLFQSPHIGGGEVICLFRIINSFLLGAVNVPYAGYLSQDSIELLCSLSSQYAVTHSAQTSNITGLRGYLSGAVHES
jgi:hypothetical protein